MKYGLTQLVSGHKAFIEIKKDEYLSITNSMKNILESIYIEQKYDLLIENFREYEMSLLYSSSAQMLFRHQNYEWFQIERMKIIRKISNILSSCRLYIDQTKHNFNIIYGNSPKIIESLKAFISNEYDSYFGYRVMEAFRNYMQHRDLPIITNFSSKRTNKNWK